MLYVSTSYLLPSSPPPILSFLPCFSLIPFHLLPLINQILLHFFLFTLTSFFSTSYLSFLPSTHPFLSSLLLTLLLFLLLSLQHPEPFFPPPLPSPPRPPPPSLRPSRPKRSTIQFSGCSDSNCHNLKAHKRLAVRCGPGVGFVNWLLVGGKNPPLWLNPVGCGRTDGRTNGRSGERMHIHTEGRSSSPPKPSGRHLTTLLTVLSGGSRRKKMTLFATPPQWPR